MAALKVIRPDPRLHLLNLGRYLSLSGAATQLRDRRREDPAIPARKAEG